MLQFGSQLAEPFSFNPRDLCQIPSATRRMSFPHVFLLEEFLGCPCFGKWKYLSTTTRT
jgi:hypothetical protein